MPHISEKLVKSLPLPTRPNQIVYDDEITGFGIRITKAGVKSFILNYSLHGTERRMTIGQHPAWSVVAARDHAKELKRRVDKGMDPLAEKLAERTALSVRSMWGEYRARHVPTLSPRSQKDVEAMFTKFVLPAFGSKKLKDVTGADIHDLHSHLTKNSGPTRANRVLEVVRGMFNKGMTWGYCEKNPAKAFQKNREQPKERFLTSEEIARLSAHLSSMKNQQAANIIRVLFFTGARLGEVLNADWSQFDLERMVWTKPSSHTKQRRKHIIPLSVKCTQMLVSLKEQSINNGLLFPSKVGKPMHDIKKPWAAICKATDLEGVRIHDLRHTYASLLVSDGESLSVIGQLLGHTQPQTTMRYAHLADHPLRRATGKIGQLLA